VKLSVLAGDGVLLHTIHKHLQLGRPSFRRGRRDPLLGPLGQPPLQPLGPRADHPAGLQPARRHPGQPVPAATVEGRLVPHTAEIMVENLDADKRPLAATADFHELFQVVSVTIREDTSTTLQLLFDADHSLEERIIAEQFLS
jgi:hypothetical protein